MCKRKELKSINLGPRVKENYSNAPADWSEWKIIINKAAPCVMTLARYMVLTCVMVLDCAQKTIMDQQTFGRYININFW